MREQDTRNKYSRQRDSQRCLDGGGTRNTPGTKGTTSIIEPSEAGTRVGVLE